MENTHGRSVLTKRNSSLTKESWMESAVTKIRLGRMTKIRLGRMGSHE